MTQPSSSRGSRTQPPGTTASRGVVLVVGALFVGLLLLWKGGSSEKVVSAADSAPTTTKSQGGNKSTTSTTPPVVTSVPAAALKVLVVNGSTVKGLAAKTKTDLVAKGYGAVSTGDATQQVTTTLIYFTTGFEGDAKALATAMGLPPARVTLMPQTPPVKSLGANQVLVVLGPDAPTAAATPTAPPATSAPTTVKK